MTTEVTARSIAARLDGSEYPLRVAPEIEAAAKEFGLVIVFGASDDLMEFRGAVHDERGCYGSATARFDSTGLIPRFEDLDHDDIDVMRSFFHREHNPTSEVHAHWCAEEGWPWTYSTNLPHVTFQIVEDGQPYCRGIVFALRDVGSEP